MVKIVWVALLSIALVFGLHGCVAHRTVQATRRQEGAVLTLSDPLRCRAENASFVVYRYDI